MRTSFRRLRRASAVVLGGTVIVVTYANLSQLGVLPSKAEQRESVLHVRSGKMARVESGLAAWPNFAALAPRKQVYHHYCDSSLTRWVHQRCGCGMWAERCHLTVTIALALTLSKMSRALGYLGVRLSALGSVRKYASQSQTLADVKARALTTCGISNVLRPVLWRNAGSSTV